MTKGLEQSRRVLTVDGKSDCLCADYNKNYSGGIIFDTTQRGDVIRAYEGKSHTLTQAMGTGGGNVPLVLNNQGGAFMSVSDESETLRAESHGHVPITFSSQSYSKVIADDKAVTLRAQGGAIGGGSENYAVQGARLRKLMPVECLRLQGFPDNWFDGVEGYSDTAAYKAIGNSMAVPVMAWIGRRIQEKENERKKMSV